MKLELKVGIGVILLRVLKESLNVVAPNVSEALVVKLCYVMLWKFLHCSLLLLC